MVLLSAVDKSEVLPGQCLEEAVDQLRAMLRQERTHYSSCLDYLKAGELSADPLKVTSKWRLKICEWVFEVVDHFGFDRDVASTALAYMDRSVSATSEATGKPVSKREYQLYAVTSLYIAIKLHGEADEDEGGCRKKLKISAFQELSRGFFTVQAIEIMERRILSLLKWNMNPPTASQIILQLLRFLPRWSSHGSMRNYELALTKVYDVAKYLTELSCCDASFFFEATPSFVAYASVLCAFDAIRDSIAVPSTVISKFLGNVAAASRQVLLPDLEQTIVLLKKLKALSPSLFVLDQPMTLARSVSLDDCENMDRQQYRQPSEPTGKTCLITATGGQDRKRPRTEY